MTTLLLGVFISIEAVGHLALGMMVKDNMFDGFISAAGMRQKPLRK